MSFSWGAGPGRGGTASLPAVRLAYDTVPARTLEVVGGRPGEVATTSARPNTGGDLVQLAAELAPMVDVWQRLLTQHLPDRSGRCRACTKGGTGLPSTSWPCSIHGIAELARRRHDGDRR